MIYMFFGSPTETSLKVGKVVKRNEKSLTVETEISHSNGQSQNQEKGNDIGSLTRIRHSVPLTSLVEPKKGRESLLSGYNGQQVTVFDTKVYKIDQKSNKYRPPVKDTVN